MKKLLALLLAAVMVLSLAACGGSGKTAEQLLLPLPLPPLPAVPFP